MVLSLMALHVQWAIIAPQALINKISTLAKQAPLILIQERPVIKTVYPALQVQFLQTTKLTFAELCISYSPRVILPYFSQHFSRTISVVLPSAYSICQNSAIKISAILSALQDFSVSLQDRVLCLDHVQLDTFVSQELCPLHLWMEKQVANVLRDTIVLQGPHIQNHVHRAFIATAVGTLSSLTVCPALQVSSSLLETSNVLLNHFFAHFMQFLSCRICLFQQGALLSFSCVSDGLLLPIGSKFQSACLLHLLTWEYVSTWQHHAHTLSSRDLSEFTGAGQSEA